MCVFKIMMVLIFKPMKKTRHLLSFFCQSLLILILNHEIQFTTFISYFSHNYYFTHPIMMMDLMRIYSICTNI